MHFGREAPYWGELYRRSDVFGIIVQQRRRMALAWADGLLLPQGSLVLEIGCGAGLTATAFAQRRFSVVATDSGGAMLELTRRYAAEVAAGHAPHLAQADAHVLGFRDNVFDLVVALGVLPWLHSAPDAVKEMARVTRPGGHLIISAGNRTKLNYLLDPLLSPALIDLKRRVRAIIEQVGLRQHDPLRATLYRLSQFDHLLSSAGLTKERYASFGFGPFTFFGRTLIPDGIGVALHHRLQTLADQQFPIVRSTAWEHIALARKASDNSSPHAAT